MSLTDRIAQGLESGWNVTDSALLTQNLTAEADVVVIGTGAGGGTTAEILARSGLSVILVEEGRLYYQKDFKMDEQTSYANLYQEGMSRVTRDGAIAILQGRCVGGSTTVNWTSSFRTPAPTLNYWAEQFGLDELRPDAMAPWFDGREERHSMAPWQVDPNVNNDILRQGCEKLGYSWQIIPRNVNGCWNLGYCGTGCPTNAKQSMLVTTIPGALQQGAELVYRARADKLIIEGDQVRGVVGYGLAENGIDRTQSLQVRARHTVMACGGINGPGLLLRSDAPDPHQRIGKRTFLHPVPATLGDFPERIDGYYGAPQSVYSDHFQWRDGVTGPVGFKLEVPPMHPGFVASIGMLHGQAHSDQMNRLPHLNMMIALLRDGFVEASQGGEVFLRDDGIPGIRYEINEYLREGIVRAWKTMTEIQFAAGAQSVRPVHSMSRYTTSLGAALQQIDELDMDINKMRVGSAHVMGGCGMGEDPRSSVVDSMGKFHHLDGLHIMDGSTFPTSIGANPQLSIYGMVAKQATALAQQLQG